MRLGKKPARHGAVKLQLRQYLDVSRLPIPPVEFGHEGLIGSAWGMFGNDAYGDCVWAGAAHETMLWNQSASKSVRFTAQSVLSDYSAVTGFNPATGENDGGTDMQQAASYRQKTGILDADGNRHMIGAYAAITCGDVMEHLYAAYLFGSVGIGITFPSTAMGQFSAWQPWAVVPGATIDGGHYIPIVARRHGQFACVTWGRTQYMTDQFFAAQNDESLVYISEEMLTGGKTLEGFDLEQLQSDLAALRGGA